MGSGFGAGSFDQVLGAIPTLFSLVAAGALTIGVETVPLAEVESAWTGVEKGRRTFGRDREHLQGLRCLRK
jgi:hypothetical protein